MNMQAFHKWLFSAKPSQKYQRRLMRLTHFSRKQLLEAASTLTWDIWNADAPVTPA